MPSIKGTLCLAFAAAFALTSFAGAASAGWGNQNDRSYGNHVDYRSQHQGWNGNAYRAPPVVYQNYNSAPAYYAPPLVYGQGVNLNISLP